MFSSASFKYITGAKRKFPFAMLTVLIFPAKSYISPNRNLCIFAKLENLPASSWSIFPV